MKHFWLVFLFVLFCGFSFAQSCILNDISFQIQSDIDNFSTNYPDCTEIEGTVRIGHFMSSTGIDDLSGLSQVTAISGGLVIHNTSLINLTGLENLKSIGGWISIYSNDSLQTIDALSNLESFEGHSLQIVYNPVLEDLKAFEQIDFQLNRVWIEQNDSLTNLDGLQGVEFVGGDLEIKQNRNLASLEGLNNLKSVGDLLVVGGSHALTDLAALSNLDSVGELIIGNNSVLTSLEGLNNTYLPPSNVLRIVRNDSLSICNIPSICNYIENGIYPRIEDNADGCNSVEEVTALCLVSNDSVEFDDDINIFPNPNTGLFRVEGVSKAMYTIHNIAGQIIQQGEITNDMFIDISNKQRGIYFISMMINDKFVKRRILKM